MPPTDPQAAARRAGPPSTTDEIRNRMKANSAGRDTKPEMLLRRELHRMGVRYRVGTPIALPGRRAVRPDLVWSGARLAVFVDGCFWHCCPRHHVPPKSNLDYWVPKLAANRRRDHEQTEALKAQGWTVLRLWEHEVLEHGGASCAAVVHETLSAIRAGARPNPFLPRWLGRMF